MMPFFSFDPAAITTEENAVPDATISGVPSLMVSCSPPTLQPFAVQGLSRVSMWPVPLAPLTAAVRTLKLAERELVQLTPRPCGRVFFAEGLPVRPLPPSLFPSKSSPSFTQVQVFSTQILAFVLPTSWVQHFQHASAFQSSTLLLTRVCPPSMPTLLASGPMFFAAAVRLPRGTIPLKMGCILTNRCC